MDTERPKAGLHDAAQSSAAQSSAAQSSAAQSSSGEVGAAVFLSGDLMFASRVRAAADAAGVDFQLATSLPDRTDIRWVIVDLATRSGALDGLMDRCRQVCPDATVLAYGPHVQVAKLEKARLAGVPIVLTRGQFDRSLGSLFENEGS
jgi:hypothetical protein